MNIYDTRAYGSLGKEDWEKNINYVFVDWMAFNLRKTFTFTYLHKYSPNSFTWLAYSWYRISICEFVGWFKGIQILLNAKTKSRFRRAQKHELYRIFNVYLHTQTVENEKKKLVYLVAFPPKKRFTMWNTFVCDPFHVNGRLKVFFFYFYSGRTQQFR